nr:hypothetical protein [uncultured Prevotella sp.]
MIDQVIWARAIVPFFVYDWSYILTFCLLFPPITERPCEVKIAPRPEKKSSKRSGFSDFICNFALSIVGFFVSFLQHEDTLNFSTWQDPGPLLLLRISKV